MEEINKDLLHAEANRLITKIGGIIRKKRLELNISQQTLAFYILSDKCVISEIERGNCKNITLFTLLKICKVLELDITDLFT